MNPKTGIPFKSILSASVIADQAIVAGSIASIALLNEEPDGLKWLEKCDVPYLAIKILNASEAWQKLVIRCKNPEPFPIKP